VRQVIDQLPTAQMLRDASHADIDPIMDKQRPIVLLVCRPLAD
jgi:hypothetical protein